MQFMCMDCKGIKINRNILTPKVGRRFWCGTEVSLIKDVEAKTEAFPMPGGEKYPFAIPNGQGLMYQVSEFAGSPART